MLKLFILILLVASVVHSAPTFAAYSSWPRADVYHGSLRPYNGHSRRHHQVSQLSGADKNSGESEIDEATLERLAEVYNNLADHILQETSPERRFEVAKLLTEGSNRRWTSIGEFLQYWSKMITELKKENEARDEINEVVDDEYDNEIIE